MTVVYPTMHGASFIKRVRIHFFWRLGYGASLMAGRLDRLSWWLWSLK